MKMIDDIPTSLFNFFLLFSYSLLPRHPSIHIHLLSLMLLILESSNHHSSLKASNSGMYPYTIFHYYIKKKNNALKHNQFDSLSWIQNTKYI